MDFFSNIFSTNIHDCIVNFLQHFAHEIHMNFQNVVPSTLDFIFGLCSPPSIQCINHNFNT